MYSSINLVEWMGLCVVNAPIIVFIPEQSKGQFHAALAIFFNSLFACLLTTACC